MQTSLSFLAVGCLFVAHFAPQVHSQSPAIEKGEEFQSSKGRVLVFFRNPQLSFVDAMRFCAARQETLAEFKDEEDLQFLNDAIKKGAMPGVKDLTYVYVGGMYVGANRFQWFETGSDITLWGPNQPDLLSQKAWDERCIVAYNAGGYWAIGDHDCLTKRSFICSSIKQPEVPQ